ncbi:MAG TPA: helix-hairpin-helix domain-containing protein [Candidatus Limnocylindrales bacterium]|nr:helix-hairpin-helix domain-containing protein [Candidatus Limnocylindrales bacterium]
MDEPAPWRALEDHPPAAGNGATGPVPLTDPGGASATRIPWLVAAFATAAVVAGIAIWLVASSGRGSVVVEGGGPAPGGSARDRGAIAIAAAASTGPALIVDVQGAVVRPGIVRLPAGARVADAIAAAGGFGPRVAADRVGTMLNLAALVKDGDQVIVPSRDDPAAAPTPGTTGAGGPGGATTGAGPLDLNRATAAELDALPGIGPVTAAKIIAARGEQAFASVDDLRSRKILGAATFDKVKDLLVVR